MSAPIAKSHFTFASPNLTYIDASAEEPNLRALPTTEPKVGLFGWVADRYAAFVAWNRTQEDAAELANMSERDLADIGLNRGDLHRVFTPEFNRDLIVARGADV
jgi:uncharacterized protein YjiS (DUF1127 family)